MSDSVVAGGTPPIIIAYPSGINWFHEAIARDIHDELSSRGRDARLLTAREFVQLPPAAADASDDVLIVNFRECAVQLSGPACIEPAAGAIERLNHRLGEFGRRILFNLDSIQTHWFATQLAMCGQSLTEIIDINLLPQTRAPRVGGCRYTWISECLTDRQLKEIPPYTSEKSIPWAIIGHATPARARVVDELTHRLGTSGFVFLPELRPWRTSGDHNLSQLSLCRVLSQVRYYVWSSHHEFAYHETLRVTHAIRNGAIPVKLDSKFAADFESLPWVYRDVNHLMDTIDRTGPRRMFEQAVETVVRPGALGDVLIKALNIANPRHISPVAASQRTVTSQ